MYARWSGVNWRVFISNETMEDVMARDVFDDVTVAIINRHTNEILFPTLYMISRISVDNNRNAFIELYDRELERKVYLTFPRDELSGFITFIFNGLENKSTTMHVDDWFLIYFPPVGEADDNVWMCKLHGMTVDGSSASIVFNWLYFKENDDDAIEKINELANSDELKQMEKVFNVLRDQDASKHVKRFSLKTGLKFLDLNKNFSPRKAAAEILQIKKFGDSYMSAVSEKEPLDIVFETSVENVERIIAGLKKIVM